MTPLMQKQIDDRAKKEGKDDKAELLKEQVVKQFVKPEHIAGYIVFLCGPDSSSITGATLTIDGGWKWNN